ncbi:SixA phosphatase family protein [Microlunatus sp. Y2014]|uniref:SixA phosphatase family protein n=1 Tax=Microlunatus sp. Y2014 TaxID=3418488 RepID=UPI003DA6EA62
MNHRLLLVRHAKSAWSVDATDRMRPLSGRGQRDATALGALLARRQIVPDVVWCSPAVRACQTWQHAVEGGARTEQLTHVDELYEADGETLASLISTAPAEARTLLVIAHNSGIVDCVTALTNRRGPAEAWRSIDRKYPTSAVAELRCPSWADLAPGTATLTAYDIPRG